MVAPSHAPPTGLDRGLERLRSFDVEARVFETATRDTEWLRANPEERAADVHRAFEDPEIDGVVAAMGGNCAHELLPHLEERTVRQNPTRFFGSSDNTHLHLFLGDAGLVSFYGGQLFPDLVVDREIHPYSRRYVERALRAAPFGSIEPTDEWTDDYYDFAAEDPPSRDWYPADGWYWHDRRERTVRGPVIGGCFSMLRTELMLESDHFTAERLEGSVLAVETSGEVPDPGELERFFSVLGERGFLDGVAGVLVGRPETGASGPARREAYRQRQRRAVVEGLEARGVDVPIVFDLDFGHTSPNLPLPLGAPVELDEVEREIRFPEP